MPDLFTKSSQHKGLYALAAPDRAADLPDAFTFTVPEHLEQSLAPGDRVTVPLGRASTPTPATIIELTTSTTVPNDKLKPISERKGTRLPFPLIDLARWIARYYATPLGSVLASMLPAAVKKNTGRTTTTAYTKPTQPPENTPPRLPPTTRSAWDAIANIPQHDFPIPKKDLRDRLGLRSTTPLTRLAKLGLLTETTLHAVKAPNPHDATTPDTTRHAPLTTHQQHAADAVTASLGTFTPHLLLGVTGSGKTEVYLRTIQATLQRGQNAIVLVPEIALTPQTAGRFVARFGNDAVAVLHSGLTAAQRNQQWTRIATGHARIAVGARSAIFAPFPPPAEDRAGVGLIIVDEEHDASYKQDQAPRYHARDVALKRAQLEQCPAILGSATPSLESFRNATPNPDHPESPPRFNLLELPERVSKLPMPRVTVVDLNEERRNRTDQRHKLHALGPTLEHALRDTLEHDRQAILLLNRRGYASFIACASPDCGFTLACDNCDAHLVYHRHKLPDPHNTNHAPTHAAYVKCHHCLEMNRLPAACPDSGHKLTLLGFGTQRLEDELAEKFPNLTPDQQHPQPLLRLDSDTMRRAADYHNALESFRQRNTRVLIGTQMIAKGLDFPGVSLVGVVNADTALNLPDFRATERTFQLAAQVAGRAGRVAHSANHATVIIQTIEPHHPAITAAAAHDYKKFAIAELAVRAAAQPPLPPVGRMARIVTRHPDHAKALDRAKHIRHAIDQLRDPDLTARGPFDAPIARIANQHRIAIELQSTTPTPIQRCLTHLRNQRLAAASASLTIDVDPIALL